jgi:hypothetical protein
MKRLLMTSLAFLAITACNNQQETAAPVVAEAPEVVASAAAEVVETKDFASLIQQAEDLYAQTKAANHAWSVNLDRLKDARQAAEEGDMDKAAANAEEAIKLSRLALVQAQAEKDLWQERVPK